MRLAVGITTILAFAPPETRMKRSRMWRSFSLFSAPPMGTIQPRVSPWGILLGIEVKQLLVLFQGNAGMTAIPSSQFSRPGSVGLCFAPGYTRPIRRASFLRECGAQTKMLHSHRVQVAVPFELAAEAPNIVLFAQTNQRAKSELYCLALGLESREPKGLLHQLVVNDDVSPHGAFPQVGRCT